MFWGKEFLGNKRKIPAFLFQEHLSFIFLGWYDGWYNNRSSYCSCSPMCVSEWKKEQNIYLFFFLFFFGNCSIIVFLYFFSFMSWSCWDPSMFWVALRQVLKNLQCYFLLCERVSFERGDWFVFLVSEWLVDDGSVGGRGWGAAGKPTVPEFEALVV